MGKFNANDNLMYKIHLLQDWGYSSVAEHSTADREVAGSTPAAPCNFVCPIFLNFYVPQCFADDALIFDLVSDHNDTRKNDFLKRIHHNF